MESSIDGIEHCHVLVVEDDIGIQQMLIGSFLGEMGIDDVVYAEDGLEGLARARERKPDLIVLDIEMPRMNGLEMLRQLRGIDGLAEIPVIVESGTDSQERREQMFLAGATDFVLKPLNSNEFKARLHVHLENSLHLRRLQTDLARIAQELADAAQLQRAMLPNADVLRALAHSHGLGVTFLFAPSSQLGGDFWGVLPMGERALGVYICDFAGHGVSAAMNTFQLHMLLSRLEPPDRCDPAAFVAALNHNLYGALRQRQYATFFFGVIDLEDDVIRYASCACPNPLLGHRSHGRIRILDGSGMPLGMQPEITSENREIPFPQGSFLFLYSDALPESLMADGHLTGTKRVVSFLPAAAAHPFQPGALAEDIRRHWPETAKFTDDLTAIWIERLGSDNEKV